VAAAQWRLATAGRRVLSLYDVEYVLEGAVQRLEYGRVVGLLAATARGPHLPGLRFQSVEQLAQVEPEVRRCGRVGIVEARSVEAAHLVRQRQPSGRRDGGRGAQGPQTAVHRLPLFQDVGRRRGARRRVYRIRLVGISGGGGRLGGGGGSGCRRR